MNPKEIIGNLLVKFREQKPFNQAAVAGLIYILISFPYTYFLQKKTLDESLNMTLFSAIMFMVVFYFASSIIMKMNAEAAKKIGGPKKGWRKNKEGLK